MSEKEGNENGRSPPPPSDTPGGSGEDYGFGPLKTRRMERKTLLDQLRDTDFGIEPEALQRAFERQQRIAAGLAPDPDCKDVPVRISPRERRMSLETLMRAVGLLWDMEKADRGLSNQIVNILQQVGVAVPGQTAAMDATIVPPEQAAEIVAQRLLEQRERPASGNGNGKPKDGSGNGSPHD